MADEIKGVPAMIKTEGGPEIPMMETDIDWLRAARLRRAAMNGDKEAQKEYERMSHNPVYYDPDDE